MRRRRAVSADVKSRSLDAGAVPEVMAYPLREATAFAHLHVMAIVGCTGREPIAPYTNRMARGIFLVIPPCGYFRLIVVRLSPGVQVLWSFFRAGRCVPLNALDCLTKRLDQLGSADVEVVFRSDARQFVAP